MDSINNLEKFLAKIHSGQTCLGMVVTLSDSTVSELAGDIGFDFTWIDAEHGPFTIDQIKQHIMACRGRLPNTVCTGSRPVEFRFLQLLEDVLIGAQFQSDSGGIGADLLCDRALPDKEDLPVQSYLPFPNHWRNDLHPQGSYVGYRERSLLDPGVSGKE